MTTSTTTRRVPRGYEGAADAAPQGVRGGQYVAEVGVEDPVVFLIGMRVNRWRKVRSWLPVAQAMPRMLKELGEREAGLLGAELYRSGRVFLVVQYWRSAEELGAFARDTSFSHAAAWGRFNKAAASSGDVGIFHETYVVPRDRIESLYGNMPVFGLGAAFTARRRGPGRTTSAAHERLGTTEPEFTAE